MLLLRLRLCPPQMVEPNTAGSRTPNPTIDCTTRRRPAHSQRPRGDRNIRANARPRKAAFHRAPLGFACIRQTSRGGGNSEPVKASGNHAAFEQTKGDAGFSRGAGRHSALRDRPTEFGVALAAGDLNQVAECRRLAIGIQEDAHTLGTSGGQEDGLNAVNVGQLNHKAMTERRRQIGRRR